jgi:hypothetical protein
MSASSIDVARPAREAGRMHDLLIFAAIVLALILLDLLALRFGADSRKAAERPSDTWW